MSFKRDPYIYKLTSNNSIRTTSNNSIRADSNNSNRSNSNNSTNGVVLIFVSNRLDLSRGLSKGV